MIYIYRDEVATGANFVDCLRLYSTMIATMTTTTITTITTAAIAPPMAAPLPPPLSPEWKKQINTC